MNTIETNVIIEDADIDNINTILPPEILLKIFEYVEINKMDSFLDLDINTTVSYLGNLLKCIDCINNITQCVHIDGEELHAAHNIRLTCNYWNELIGSHFKYKLYIW
jgi:hypothetical protein